VVKVETKLETGAAASVWFRIAVHSHHYIALLPLPPSVALLKRQRKASAATNAMAASPIVEEGKMLSEALNTVKIQVQQMKRNLVRKPNAMAHARLLTMLHL